MFWTLTVRVSALCSPVQLGGPPARGVAVPGRGDVPPPVRGLGGGGVDQEVLDVTHLGSVSHGIIMSLWNMAWIYDKLTTINLLFVNTNMHVDIDLLNIKFLAIVWYRTS